MIKHYNLSLKHVRTFKTPAKKTTYKYFDYVLYALFLFFLIQQLLV